MTDPRFTDDPRLNDPVIRRDETVGGMWGWIAGVAVVLLIAFLIIAGWNSNSNTASSGPSTTSPASTPAKPATSPSTTGSGSSAPQQFTPAPSNTAAPPKSDTQ